MPKVAITPLVKLTKEQMKVLLERAMTREGKVPEPVAKTLLERGEPIAEKRVGQLTDITSGQIKYLPIEQARAKYAEMPEFYKPGGYAAPVKEIAQVPPGSPEELAAGITYQRVRPLPVVPPPSRDAVVMSRELERINAARELEKSGLNPEYIRPDADLKTIAAMRGIEPKKIETTPAAELASDAMVASSLWKQLGGARSTGGKLWETLWQGSRLKNAPHIKTGRDYFISSFVRWRVDPTGFKEKFPREYRLLNQIWQEFESTLPE